MIGSFLNNFRKMCFLMLSGCFIASQAFSQAEAEIPIGNWRAHLSYTRITNLAIGAESVYAASDMGILIFNKSDNSVTTLNKLNGLSSSGISSIALDNATAQLMIAYEDGNIDLLDDDNSVTNFSRLRDLNTVVGSKKIHHILIQQNLAYLSANYGIVVFNLSQHELKETWRDLGRNGEAVSIFKLAFLNDSIVAATDKGIIMGSVHDNLLDFNNWKRFDAGDLSGKIDAVTIFNGKIYAAVNNKGIFHYENNTFVQDTFLQNATFQSLEGSADHLLISAADKLWQLSTNGQLAQIADDEVTFPLMTLEDENNVLWIADANNGLVSNVNGDFNNYLPNGPTTQKTSRLKYYDNRMYAVSGGLTLEAGGKTGTIDYFENGLWKTIETPLRNLTDIEFSGNKMFASSFGDGLLQIENSVQTIYDHSNSPLENTDPSGKAVNISALEISDAGLWVTNFGAAQPIHLLKPDNTWQSFPPAFTSARYPTDLIADLFGNVWMAASSSHGGGLIVVKPESGQSILLNDVEGSGGLLNRFVRSLALDREGNIWVGTQGGVAYFFSETEDAVKPIFQDRFLLKDETITAIEVDGGNRKWIGTERGVWLVSPTAEELVYNFTTENSPLFSNIIHDIEINNNTGEVFFSTEKGVISFRGDATKADNSFDEVKIFPNPVTAEFTGTIGISGLSADAFVKITDVSGKLIWQIQAQGGTATWNVRDYNGRRASTGIYLVFASSAEGKESIVGKIAVIE